MPSKDYPAWTRIEKTVRSIKDILVPQGSMVKQHVSPDSMTRDCTETILWNRNECYHQTTKLIPKGDPTLYPTSGKELVKINSPLKKLTFKRIKLKGDCSAQIKLVMIVRSKRNDLFLIEKNE